MVDTLNKLSTPELPLHRETNFTPERITQVRNLIPPLIPEISQSMMAADTSLAPIDVQRNIGAELGRIEKLVGTIHKESYEAVLRLLNKAGKVDSESNILEVASSWSLAPWLLLEEDIQPATLLATDYSDTTVAAATAVYPHYKSTGYLPHTKVETQKVNIKRPDDFSDIGKYDLVLSSLGIQYTGVERMMTQTLEHADIVAHTDLAHEVFEVSAEDFAGGVIEMTSKDDEGNPVRTGLRFIIDHSSEMDTPLGELYEAEIITDRHLYEESGYVYDVPVPEEKRKTVITVNRENGRLNVLPWGFKPTPDATEEDCLEFKAVVLDSLTDVYKNDDETTGGAWPGNSISEIPAYAAYEGIYAVVTIKTQTNPDLTTETPVNIVRFHMPRIRNLAQKGKIRSMREGSPYADPQVFSATLAKWADPHFISSKFTLYPPPLMSVIVTRKEEDFNDILEATQAA